MNLFIFFFVWAAVYCIPIPPIKSLVKPLPRVITLLLGLFLFFVFVLFLMPMSLLLYWLIYSRLLIALLECAFQRKKWEEQSYNRHFWRRLRITRRLSGKIIALLFILYLVACVVGVIFWQVQRVGNASYFNNFIQLRSGLPFNRSIPDSMVRLVTKELAISVARRHMSEFGSNMRVLDCHITKTLEGKLVWVAVVGSTNVLAENYVKGFIVIDATDPAVVPQIAHKEFSVGQGLWWDHSITFRSYLSDVTYSYGISYPSWDPTTGELVYVVIKYNVGLDLIRRYAGLLIYDSEGKVMYDFSSMPDIPEWVTQVYDEDWLEHMINEWGGFRRGETFDYWAGGFLWIVPPSRERVEMSEDTRYIVDPETGDIIAMVCVNPVESERTLAGIFIATHEGIFFYNYSEEDYISGTTAEDIVEGKLPKPAAGLYYAEMPLLYPVEISGDLRLVWYVPIYWREGTGAPDETIYLAGFAMIDARDINLVSINMAGEGLTSEQLVRSTRYDFMRLFGAVTFIELDTRVVDKFEYVEDGTTHVVLHVDNSTYPWIEATSKILLSQQWYELLSTESGQRIMANIEKRGDLWIMVYFDNLDIQ